MKAIYIFLYKYRRAIHSMYIFGKTYIESTFGEYHINRQILLHIHV